MIQLPEGFSAAALFTELFQLAAPFVGIAALFGCGYLILNMLRNAPK
ncbi:hypothetical protein JWJ90_13410 [Desulfobulbus rhabdoformis]|nr:hypothetical protein [Desulfobulbus rhabdoformis]MBM9615276.1 hypothetical protein [Desulfobulbus rhabdoformis]